jgi:uncharacterized protein YndB with AHSA1/START domain
MNALATDTRLEAIVVEEVLPHSAATIWAALTSGALMARWLMPPEGFEPVVGNCFTFRTRAAGAWDGTIRCEVLEVVPERRFRYAWRSGHPANVGYGSPLDTVVAFTLEPADGGTRLRMVHSGFELPLNDTAYQGMSEGWPAVVARLAAAAQGQGR